MSDRTGATIGFVCAGLATAVAVGAWPADGRAELTIAATGLATLAFFLRRRDFVDRRVGAPIAGGFSLLSATVGLLALGGAATATLGELDEGLVGPGMVALAGAAALVGAWIDWAGVGRERVVVLTRRTGAATGIGVLGIASIVLWQVVIGSFVISLGGESLSPVASVFISTIALGLGTATVGAAFLTQTGRGLDFVDARVPYRRGWIYVVVGTATLLGANIGIEFVFSIAGVESSTHSLVRAARDAPEILLVLVPLSYLVVGPGEELLYRNVVQKYLAATFSKRGSIVVASLIFAGVHLPAYADPDGTVLALVNTLAVVFVLSLVLGVAYAKTENVVVSALVHGSFNAIAFAITYVELTDVVGVLTDGCLTRF